jgi:hypothetical protein
MARKRQENWSGPDDLAQEKMALPAVPPWTVWVLVKKNDITTLRRTRPFTLSEELREDARNYFTQIIKDFVDAPPWPSDIDAWRTAYDPMRAADRWLTRKGFDPANISVANKAAIAATMEIAGAAIIYGHGKAPGAPD